MHIVLVVDDEFGIAELIDAVLTDEGYRVLTAANGRQGLETLARETLAREPPALVFLDYMMPVMDGAAVLRAMAADAAFRTIPVVLMSSVAEPVVAKVCSGYAAFLNKPFRITELTAVAERLIGKGMASSG
jgi:CheY-like chemotaxis protein